MTTLNITINDKVFAQIEASARRDGITPEEWLTQRLEHLLTSGDDDIDRAADYLLNKNAELYRRLA